MFVCEDVQKKVKRLSLDYIYKDCGLQYKQRQYFINKMNLAIKVGNLQYLKLMEQLLFSKVQLKTQKINIVKLPYYNFIDLLIQIFSEYIKGSQQNIHFFILQYFYNKYETAYELFRHMYGCITMWKKYVESQQQSRILLSLLSAQRNSRESIRLFLRIRRQILKNTNNVKIMQEVLLNHEDIIAISHSIFSKDMKAYVAKKIKELFINVKKKSLYSNNKINGAVICQFFMNCAEKFQKQELDNIKQYYCNAPPEEKQLQQEILKKRTFKPLKSECHIEYIQTLDRLEQMQEIIENEQTIHKTRSSSNIKGNKDKFIINNVYENHLQEKDQNRKEYDIKDNQNPIQNAKYIFNRKYSYSWQKFLRTNQEMKEKLLKGHQEHI